jgi:aspartate racemase
VVAFEMAQQLKAAGEEIDLLLLIDSDAPGTTKYLHTRPYLLMLADWHLGELLRRPLPAQLEYVGGKLRTAALAIKGLLTGNKAEGSLERSSRKVQDANLRALLNYQPQEYDGRIVLFWCSETPTRCYEDRRLAWSDVAQRGLELHVIPGNHMSMIEHPHVNVMAATLRDCLGALPRTSAAPKTKVAFA